MKGKKSGRGIFGSACASKFRKFTPALDQTYMYMRKAHYLSSLVYLFTIIFVRVKGEIEIYFRLKLKNAVIAGKEKFCVCLFSAKMFAQKCRKYGNCVFQRCCEQT